jgi:hypothetical protein
MLALEAGMTAGGTWLFFSAFGRLKLRRAVEDTPTSKLRSLAMGKAEAKGLGLALDAPAIGPFSGEACLWFRWLVEEERTSTDSKGNTSKTWVMLAKGESLQPFQLDDGSGRMTVLPAGAEIDAPRLFSYSDGGLFSGSPPAGPLYGDYRGGMLMPRRRFTEWRLDEGLPLYILGVARPAGQGLPVALGRGRAGEPFYISHKAEGEISQSLLWGVAARLGFGTLLAVAGPALAAHQFFGW